MTIDDDLSNRIRMQAQLGAKRVVVLCQHNAHQSTLSSLSQL